MSFEDLMDAFNSGDEVSCYKTMKVRDFIEFNPKESLKKGELATKVTMDKLLPFEKFISSMEQAPFSGGSKFRNGDTLLARITPCLENGKTAFVDGLKEGEVAFGSTEFIVLRCREGVSDPQYIYYLATSSFFRNVAIKSMVGSSGRQRVQIGALEDIDIKVPSLEEQRRIASRLALLDSKIALNSRINDNLQQQAQLIYNISFEKADFHDLPSGWRVVSLGDVATISTKAFNPQKEPITALEHYSIPAFDENKFPTFESSSNIKSNKFIIDSSCFLISKLNPTTKRVWKPYCLSERAVCSTEFIVYRAKDNSISDFLYSVIDSQSFTNYMCTHVNGSTGSRQRTTPSETLSYKLLLPSRDVLERFQSMVSPMYDLTRLNSIENNRLKQLREALLQKLMSEK